MDVVLQANELDAYLCKQELEAQNKVPRRDMEDLLEVPRSYVSMRTVPSAEDDVFLKPPLWEDITSSIQKLDPENAEMLGAGPHVKLEMPEDIPLIKTEPSYLMQYPQFNSPPPPAFPMSRVMYAPPPTPPISDPGSPGNSLPRRTPPPPYPAPVSVPNHHSVVPPPPTPQVPTSATPTATTAPNVPKYNRRNNPELEKRRIHHCDFLGKLIVCFILYKDSASEIQKFI